MASASSTPVESSPTAALAPARSEDPAWSHGKVVLGAKNSTICLHCNKKIGGGGITRLKYHLAGIKGQVEACKKVPHDVKWQMKQLIVDLEKNDERRKRTRHEIGSIGSGGDSNEGSTSVSESRGRPCTSPTPTSSATKQLQGKSFFAPRTISGSQPSIKSALASKEMIAAARDAMARWWYDANIPFNAANSPYYLTMVDAIASIGSGFVPPTYHDYRGGLLKNAVHVARNYVNDLKKEWTTYGCSIMTDGWTSRRQEPIINFLAYSPRGTMFLKSIDTSGLRKDKETLLELFDQVVKEVGPENVVQFVSDNDASYKAAGQALQHRYGTFFWSPCAAHCIDLMLENLSDPRHFPIIDETIKKARKITKFIYNHSWVLSLMRQEFTNGRELCRPAVTRFATHFLSLQCLLKFKKELRQMFTCDKWVGSNHAKSNAGKEIASIVLEDAEFWDQCQHIVMVTEPLVRILQLVDSDEKPSMGYLYEAMDKAKECIKKRLRNKLCLYGQYIRVIDARWDKQLHSPLHAAGCFLNPGIYFSPNFTKQKEVGKGLITTIMRLVPDLEVQDTVFSQLEEYKKSIGLFGMLGAVRQREKLNPGDNTISYFNSHSAAAQLVLLTFFMCLSVSCMVGKFRPRHSRSTSFRYSCS